MNNDINEHIDEHGRVKIDELSFMFCDIEKEIDGFFAENWISTFDGNKYLIKTLADVKTKEDYSNNLYKVCEMNALVMPRVLKQIGMPTATYKLGNYNGRDVIMSPSFLSEDEKLIEGDKILDIHHSEVTEVNYIMKVLIKKYGRAISNEFLIECFANKFINEGDERNRNWGVVHNKKTNMNHLAPMYDFDFSGLSTNRYPKRFVDSITSDSLYSFMEEYYHLDFVKEFLINIINSFDLEKVFEEVENEERITISEEYKNAYRKMFASSLRSIQTIMGNMDKLRM